MSQHLQEALGAERQVDVRDDLGPAQNTLQTVGLEDAMELRQQVEHLVHKAGDKSTKRSPRDHSIILE